MPDSDVRIGFVAEGQAGVGSALDFVRDKLQQHRLEMRQQMGMARLLGRELAMMGLDAKGAGGEVAHLVAAFAVGGGIAGAVATVGVLASYFRDADRAAQELLGKLKKDAKDAAAELQAVLDKLAGISRTQRTILDLQGQRKKLAKDLAAIEAGAPDTMIILADGTEQWVRSETKAERILREQLKELDDQLEKRKQINEAEGALSRLNEKPSLAKKESPKLFGPGYGADLGAFYENQKKQADAYQKWLDEWEAAQKRTEDDLLRWREERREQEQKKAKQDFEDLVKVSKQFTDSVVQGLDQMIFRGGSFKDAMMGVFNAMKGVALSALSEILAKELAGAVAGMAAAKAEAISTTAGHTAAAVAGAAASQAFIPFAGPGLAAAAAGEMLALVSGMTAPLLAFERGTPYVPHTGLALIHEGERIIPADENRRGGGGLNITIHALDGADVERVLLRNQGALLRTLSSAAGNRRMR